MSRDGWAALPRGATGLSAVYSLTIFLSTQMRISLLRVDSYPCLQKLKSITVFLYMAFQLRMKIFYFYFFIVEVMFNLQSKDFLTRLIHCY